MRVEVIRPGTRIYDTVMAHTPATLRALKDDGADGVALYLGGNATADTVANAHALAMGVMFVNYSRGEGWLPSAAIGEGDAVASVKRLTALGVPMAGLFDWCDLEGAGGNPDGYLDAWAHVVTDVGRLSGMYVGAGAGASGHELYRRPQFVGYWQAGSIIPTAPDCGWMLEQIYPLNLQRGGMGVDISFSRHDWKNRAPTWVVGD